jgi:hypothetical protein
MIATAKLRGWSKLRRGGATEKNRRRKRPSVEIKTIFDTFRRIFFSNLKSNLAVMGLTKEQRKNAHLIYNILLATFLKIDDIHGRKWSVFVIGQFCIMWPKIRPPSNSEVFANL